MSLLNDALRKKDRERRPTAGFSDGKPAIPAPPQRRPRIHGLTVLAGGLLLAAALGVAFVLQIRPAPSAAGAARASVVTIPAATPRTAPAFTEAIPVAAAVPAPSPVDSYPPRGAAGDGPGDAPTAAVEPAARPEARPSEAKRASAIAAARETPAPLPDAPPDPAASEAPPSESPRRREPLPTSAKTPAAAAVPTPVERYYRKARSSHRQGRLERAVALYREVLRLAPHHTEARFNLVSAYIDLKAFAEAGEIAEELRRQQPDSPQVVVNLAIARIGLGRYEEALQLLDQAQALPQASPFPIWFHKGIACRGRGQLEAAIGWYRKAEALNPTHRQLLFNMALAYDRLEDYRQAVHYYQAYLQQAPGAADQPRKEIRRRMTTLTAYLASEAPAGKGAP